ncbi:hypothetical protein GH714_012166 [Hevea brasiliensis]|uniref:Uncharacterized protein n=1 Tax=Hevea brasiliensis TaxID=3981 RepID=A0A6A6KDK8_HEVBR|nr:hypothetical protein GH714_012166 [Hevea brasiliensis]
MGEEKKPQPAGVWPTVKPFVNGGASGMLATCVIQPIDMIKVRIQLGQGSAAQVTKTMLKEEGFGAFYKGLSAGLLRQATYTTARLGSFNPADLALIRMQADATLPAAQRRNYTNAFHALYRIVADEFWHSGKVQALQLDSLGSGEAATVLGASTVSGFFASACSLPFDYVKTQIQKMQPDARENDMDIPEPDPKAGEIRGVVVISRQGDFRLSKANK